MNSLAKLYVYIPTEQRYKEYDCGMNIDSAMRSYDTFRGIGDKAMVVISSPEMHGEISKLLLDGQIHMGCMH